MPKTTPRWPPIARIVAGFLELLGRTEGKSERLSVVEAVREFGRLSGDLAVLGLEPPGATIAPLQWPHVLEWMLSNVRELTQGRHIGLMT